VQLSTQLKVEEGGMNMSIFPAPADMRNWLKDASERRSLLRGFIVSAGGVVFMFCCLAVLALSSCALGG
jgi:hypothetical protein